MVKISELKLDKIRKNIPFIDANGDKQYIKIYNVTEETKQATLNIVRENVDEEGKVEIGEYDTLLKLFPLFTDLEIDTDNIEEIVKNPSKEMILINSEILSIINEISMEEAINQNIEYEKLILMYEQAKGLNMVAYLRERIDSTKLYRDFDPLNIEAKEEVKKRELEEMKASYEAVVKIYEETIQKEKEKEADKE